jgi:hypothetical protein
VLVFHFNILCECSGNYRHLRAMLDFFQNLFLIRASWISFLYVGILLGLIIQMCSNGLDLIGFSYLQNGKNDFN